MNDKQREYLLKSVTAVYSGQVDALRKKRIKKPSLNNYLIAAFLDNTIEFADIQNLKDKMREAVIKFPSSAQLVQTERKSYGDDAEETENVKIPVRLIFKIPANYEFELALWEQQEKEIDEEIKQLTAQLKTIEVKIHLGSNQQLDKLIAEADNLGEISLINSKLQLTA